MPSRSNKLFKVICSRCLCFENSFAEPSSLLSFSCFAFDVKTYFIAQLMVLLYSISIHLAAHCGSQTKHVHVLSTPAKEKQTLVVCSLLDYVISLQVNSLEVPLLHHQKLV